MVSPMKYHAVLAVMCTLACIQASAAEVVAVYTVSRHGARNALPKTSLLKESGALGGPTLLPEGQRLCYNAGLKFRSRYLDDQQCGATCLRNSSIDSNYGLVGRQGYNNYNTLVRASYTDRAVLSAVSFYSGVFPTNPQFSGNVSVYLPNGDQLVPVYTTPEKDDFLIRAYTKCNTYQQRLTQWYASAEFTQREEQSRQLRETVRTLLNSSTDTGLTNWWNVFDGLDVYYTWKVGPAAPVLPADVWQQTRELAMWLETAKMRASLAGNLLGGPALADLLLYLEAAINALRTEQPEYYKLVSLSAHYNLQLGMLAALSMDTYGPAVAALPWLNGSIPELASLLVFELHSLPASGSQPTDYAVRLVAQQGPNASYVTVPLPCAQAGDAAEQAVSAGACVYSEFKSLVASVQLPDVAAWCQACNNTDASACAVLAAQSAAATAQAALTAVPPCDGPTDRDLQLAIGLGVSLTFVVTAAVCALGFWWYLRRHDDGMPAFVKASSSGSGVIMA